MIGSAASPAGCAGGPAQGGTAGAGAGRAGGAGAGAAGCGGAAAVRGVITSVAESRLTGAAICVAGRGGGTGEHHIRCPSSGWPSRSTQSSVISTRCTRWAPRKVPLVLPTSSSSQVAPSIRSTAWRQDTRASLTTMSDSGLRPML